MPIVSWLLATNREDALLHRAIDSCLTQTMADFELLLIVNGIGYEEIVTSLSNRYKDERVRVIGTPVHYLNFSLSLGLHMAKGMYVSRMDADDISVPERLEVQLAFMEEHPDVVVLGSDYELINADGVTEGCVVLPHSDREIRKKLYYRNPICHPSVMMRREAVLSVGGYLGGVNAQDYDLWTRLASVNGYKFANLPRILLKYNSDDQGAARNSRIAYCSVIACQARSLLLSSWDLRWLLGIFKSVAGLLLNSTKN